MARSSQLNLECRTGDGCAFLQWSTISYATSYKVETKSWKEPVIITHETQALECIQTSLRNGELYWFRVTAIDKTGSAKESAVLKNRPRAGQKLFPVLVKRLARDCRVLIKWPLIRTEFGYRIERNDLATTDGFQHIASISSRVKTRFADATCCDPVQHPCSGHQYRVSILDRSLPPNMQMISKTVFCLRTKKLDAPTSSTVAPSVEAFLGDLNASKTDVIVVCSTSAELMKNVFAAAGDTVKVAYETAARHASSADVIPVAAGTQLACQKIYFLAWKPNSNQALLVNSLKSFVSEIFDKALAEGFRTVAFPAIGCGKYGCSISTVARALVEEANRLQATHPIAVSFVIQPGRQDVLNEFQKCIGASKEPKSTSVESVTINVRKGTITIEKGDLTSQKIDAIAIAISSEFLRETVLNAAGDEVRKFYENAQKTNPNTVLISSPPGQLPCQRIFFVQWQPKPDEAVLQQSIDDFMWNVVQNAISHNFSSIALPSIGCGKYGYDVGLVVKSIIRQSIKRLQSRDLNLAIKIVVHPSQENVYDEFCRKLTLAPDAPSSLPSDHQVPATWEKSAENKKRILLQPNSDEFKSVSQNFLQSIRNQCSTILRIERIQNERWYIQYSIHHQDFQRRLNADTERRLFHGCPQATADAIIETGFNRSYAGKNGTLYGFGVYFSSQASYSHDYAVVSANQERCMFLCRVLVGKTTPGNRTMKIRPLGFDSTTDGDHIFVTYHDAQAYAEYLITYK